MPGLDEKNISVDVAGGVLTVKGHKEEDKVEKKQDFHCASGASARSPTRFAFPKRSTPTRSRPTSRMAC
jgi:HSP20 family molecular chaperone IbpA